MTLELFRESMVRLACDTFQSGKQFIELNRFGEVLVHPGGQTALTVTVQRMRCCSNHRHMPFCSFQLANPPCNFESIDIGHLNIHQHCIEALAVEASKSFVAAGHCPCAMAVFLENPD